MLTNSAAAQLATTPLGIKITSPTRGQQIPADTNSLKINGFSNQGDLLHCNVYVIVNNIKPYQKAISSVTNNKSSNPSTWVYYLVPTYTSIKIGANKVTSKLACESNNNTAANGVTTLTKFYSINFTGITRSGANPNGIKSPAYTNAKLLHASPQTHSTTAGVTMTNSKAISRPSIRTSSDNIVENKTQTTGASQYNQLTRVNAATLLSTAGIISKNQAGMHQNNASDSQLSSTPGREHRVNSLSAPSSTATGSNIKSKNPSNSVSQAADNSVKPVSSIKSKSDNIKGVLTMSIHLSQHVAQPGERENMTLGVTDGNKTHAIVGATVYGRIVDPTGVYKKLAGTTDNEGKVRYSWLIAGNDSTNGSYKLTMSASAPGYQNNSITKMLRVVPVAGVSPTFHPTSIFGVNGNLINSTNSPKSMPLASANIPTTSKAALQPHESLPLAPRQNSSYLESIKIKMDGRVYIPSSTSGISAGALPFTNGKVSIPISTPQANMTKIPISAPQTNMTKSPKVSVPNIPKNSPNSNPLIQNVAPAQSPAQSPQLPNNNDKTPFIIATPVLHITNGTSGATSGHLYGISAALNIVDRMRFLEVDSIKGGLTSKKLGESVATGVTPKNTVFVPSSSDVSSN